MPAVHSPHPTREEDAILNFKNDAAAGVERGKGFSGIHHIGFQVENLDAIADRLTSAGMERRHDVEAALGVGSHTTGNVEVKWMGTPTFGE